MFVSRFLIVLALCVCVANAARVLSTNKCLAGCDVPFATVTSTTTPPSDEFLFVWSAVGAPTVAVAYYTQPTVAKITLNATEFLRLAPSSASLAPSNATEQLVFGRVLEFDDSGKTAIYTPSLELSSLNLTTETWTPFSYSSNNCSATTCTVSNHTVCVTFTAFSSTERNPLPPQEILSVNSTKVQVTINSYPFKGKTSKLALEVFFVAGPTRTASLVYVDHSSIDDEYTPTVFHALQVNSVASPQNANTQDSAYTSWKPIAYLSSPPDSSSTTTATANVQAPGNTTLLPPSFASVIVGENSPISVVAAVISFGIPQDKSYNPSFTQWSGLTGYGYYITEALSGGVIGLISFAMGLPVAIVVGGGGYVIVKKRRTKNQGYTAIN